MILLLAACGAEGAVPFKGTATSIIVYDAKQENPIVEHLNGSEIENIIVVVNRAKKASFSDPEPFI